MRLHIEHTTTYRYKRPMRFHRHRLVIRPREGHDLRVEQLRLHLEPANTLVWVRDVFGNSVALVDWSEASDVLRIFADMVVDRLAPFPARELHNPWLVAFPPAYDPLEANFAAVYQQPSFADSVDVVQAWLNREMTPDPDDAEGTALALCRLVHRTVRYLRRSEKGVQSPATTLELRTGSCRDLATLMMDAARLMGVAARFASGYLHGPASITGRGSTHAWADVYLPLLGWRGFDPTIGSVIGLNHVVTGVSSHPRGVMPVSGSFNGAGEDCISMTATVKTEEIS